MSNVKLSSGFLAEIAGWEAMKQARAILASSRVLDSSWEPPLLRGTVQAGTTTYKSGLLLRSQTDIENLCPCRDSRQRGIICAHSVAVGLYHLERQQATIPPHSAARKPTHAPPTAVPPARTITRAIEGQSGEPLEIFLILPPDLPEAIRRGKVMLYAEGKWSPGRVPLNVLPPDVPFVLAGEDQALLDRLESLADGDTPAMLQLSSSQFAEMLPALAEYPRVSLGKSRPLRISAEAMPLEVSASLEESGEILLRLRKAVPGQLVSVRPPWVLLNNEIRPLSYLAGIEPLLQGCLRIPRAQVPWFLNQVWATLTTNPAFETDFTPEDFSLEPVEPSFQLHLTGGLAMLQARFECFYHGRPANDMGSETSWLPDPSDPTRYGLRHFQAEQQALARLLRQGFTSPDAQGLCHLKGQHQVLNFFAREYPRLQREWKVTLEERLERSTHQNIERIDPRFAATPSGQNWFDFEVSYSTSSGQRFSAAEIQRLLLSGQSHTRLRNGRFAVLDTGAVEELQEVLVDCHPEQQAGRYRISNAQAGFLEATLRRQPDWQVQAPPAWKTRAALQTGEVPPQPPDLGPLEHVLRPYQTQGVAWLRFLRVNRFGGILADEMGLGKTVQVLAHLASSNQAPFDGYSARPQSTSNRLPCLVVCPSSLVFNWVAEAAKFTPHLRLEALEGPDRRERFSRIPNCDLAITSYALLRRDFDFYRELEFDTVVLDEAQHIKNRQTQNAQAVKAVRSRHRLVLTGTPLENSVLDLWSIFDFLMPGYLGSALDFRERYEVPITREKNPAVQERLARRVRPFLLRRLKREVAADLPAKIEQVSYCDMTEAQRALYQQILDASRREILQSGGEDLARSRMVVLTALLRLRQVCCDPRLLKLETPEVSPDGPERAVTTSPQVAGSGKFELFLELLEEVLDGNHRVLVFSQFTSMLKLLRDHLDSQAIDVCYLDGTTRDRASVVQRFQRDSTVPVFLISLKAGGTGLNLTGADTVIHFDPWWNPAVEAQATDRAHRLGQKRVVTSYKLVTRGTVEEKILQLQKRKQALLDTMLGGDDQFAQTLNWEEIQELLAG